MTKSCLIVDEIHTCLIDLLKADGYIVNYAPDIDRETILKIIGQYNGIVVRSKTLLDTAFFKAATHLKFIARAGAGLDQIDVLEAGRRKIEVVNAPEGNRDALAEHCIALLLCLLNKIHTADRDIRNNKWEREFNRGHELMHKTVGLIGYGFMGMAFAKRLAGFGCNVLAYDKYKEGFSDQFVKEVDLNQIFDQCDVVSFHVPLTKETHKMANYDFLNSFRKKIYLLNTARGEILPLDALKQHLENKKVLGAALDVLENENFDSLTSFQTEALEYLKNADNVLFTPHVAGWTFDSFEKISRVLYQKIKKLRF